MDAVSVSVSAPPPSLLAIDTNGSTNGAKRKTDGDIIDPVALVPHRLGCGHVPKCDGHDWLRTQIHTTLHRVRHSGDAKHVPWDTADGAPCLRDERVLCLSCEFSGRREDALDDAQCFLTHAMRANHHFALLPRKKQLFCARCLDFVYPDALLALTQHAMPSSRHHHHNGHAPRALQPRHHPHPHRHHDSHHPHHHHRAPSLRRRLMRSAARRGLVNMGNTCFMNAVLQALAHNPLVQHEYFVVRGHNTTICEQKRRQHAQGQQQLIIPQALPAPVEPCMGCEMSSLLQTLFPAPRATLTARHLTSPVVPQSFMETFWASAPSFIGAQQQDAHEFLVTLLNGVHKDTCPRSPVGATNDANHKPTSPRFTPTGQPLCDCVVHQNFAGVFSSEISCVFCDTVSSKYDPFLDITLSLESPIATPRKSNNRTKDESSDSGPAPAPLSLVSLLERFTYEERLKGSNQVYCRRCSRYVDAMKRLVIHRLPNLLVLHLGRFDFAKKRKILDAVTFPLRGLDLREFCSDAGVPPQHDAGTPSSGMQHRRLSRKDVMVSQSMSGRSSPMTPPPMTPPPGTTHTRDAMYDLAAVISHHGDSVDGGHFTAFVHSSQEHAAASGADRAEATSPWLHFDDSKVERVTAQRVEECQAYMLLYVRRRVFV